MRLVSTMTCWLALGLICALPATAQSANPEFAPTFGEIVDVRVINLEVVVTDGKERVGGLAGEDFRLLVDGQEVPIEYFTEVQGGRALSSGAGGTAAIPALEPGEGVGTRYLVFIDDSFSLRHKRNRVLRRLSEQLPLLGTRDQMAVVAFDGLDIDMLTSWTGSLAELERVFDRAQERPANGLIHLNRRRLGLYDGSYFGAAGGRYAFADSRGGFPAGPAGFPDSTYGLLSTPRGSRLYDNVVDVVDAATSVLRGFAKPPGRKVMLLLSGGWPAAESGFSSTVDYSARSGYGLWTTDRSVYRPMIDTANRLGYTLYPVDVNGLQSHFGGAQFASVRDAELYSSLAREREWIEEGALLDIARETGGRALLDSASLKALERAVEDTRSYYWLGFSPTWREDDRRHRVKVEVRGKGLEVRSRKSFSDLSSGTEMTMLVESAQLFDLPLPGEDLPLTVLLGAPENGGFRKLLVPMRLHIPLDQLTLLPDRDGYVAQVELRVAATDDRGEHADIPVIPVELTSESADGGEVAVYDLRLKLRRRPHQLVISLNDPASGTVISKRVAFRPPTS